MASSYTSSFGGRSPIATNVTFRGNGYSTDPGREGDPALIQETPGQTNLLNERAALDAQAAQDAANAAAETARGQGNAAATAIRVQAGLDEAEAYRIAAGTAGSNADLEQQATAITALQQARQVRATIGAQMADVASAGFAEAGSNISLLRDSISQGAITDALTRLQGNINAGGYLAQQQASSAEADAARSASAAEAASGAGESQASQLLAQQYAAAGVLATSQSANLAAALAANPTDLTSRGTIGRGGIAPAGGTTGFAVKAGGSDPFLTNTTLVNPGYDAAYANDPFGDKAAAAAASAPAAAAAPTQLYDARTGQAANNTTFSGSSGGTGTGGETIGPAATPSFVDESIITDI